MAESDRLLTIRDVQDRLAVKKDTAYALVASGSIPSIKLGAAGRLIRVRPESLERWLAEQESGANAAVIGWTPPMGRGGRGHARR